MRSMISSAVSSVQIVGSSLADDHKLFRPTRDPKEKYQNKKKKFRCCYDCFVVYGCLHYLALCAEQMEIKPVRVVSGSAVKCVSVGWTLARHSLTPASSGPGAEARDH